MVFEFPKIGVELEVPLDVSSSVLYEIMGDLQMSGVCVSVEDIHGRHLRRRVEIKLCSPMHSLDDIVNYFRYALEKLRESYRRRTGRDLNVDEILEKFDRLCGSTHVTLDVYSGSECGVFDMRSYTTLIDMVKMFDTSFRGYTAYRCSKFSTLSPSHGVEASVGVSAEKENKNDIYNVRSIIGIILPPVTKERNIEKAVKYIDIEEVGEE